MYRNVIVILYCYTVKKLSKSNDKLWYGKLYNVTKQQRTTVYALCLNKIQTEDEVEVLWGPSVTLFKRCKCISC